MPCGEERWVPLPPSHGSHCCVDSTTQWRAAVQVSRIVPSIDLRKKSEMTVGKFTLLYVEASKNGISTDSTYGAVPSPL